MKSRFPSGCALPIASSRNSWKARCTSSPPSPTDLNRIPPPMQKQTRLFVASIIALVAIAFGFVIRAFLLNEWGVIFNLSETQKGSIQGAGLYPQALSIIFFSLVIDRIGYGRTIAFAFVAHIVSVIITVT